MLNPVVLPLPAALLLLAMIGAAAYLWRHWVESGLPNLGSIPIGTPPPPPPPPPVPPTTGGRHRIGVASEPYQDRPWAKSTAVVAADWRKSLSVDRLLPTADAVIVDEPWPLEISGHDDRPFMAEIVAATSYDEKTEELVTV